MKAHAECYKCPSNPTVHIRLQGLDEFPLILARTLEFSLDDFELGGGNWRKVSFGYLNACESVSHSVVFHSLEPHRLLASQDSLSLEFSRQEYRNGKPFPSPGDPPDPGIQPGTPALQADSLLSEPPGGSLGEC